MKKTRFGLMASIFSLVIALLVTSVSTYAWFAENTVVTVESISVTAKSASPYLEIQRGIKEATDSGYTTKIEGLGSTKTEMELVTPSKIGKAAGMEWVTSKSDDPNLAKAKTAEQLLDRTEASKVTVINTETELNKRVLKETFTLHNASKTVDADHLRVYAKVTFTSGDDAEMNQAVRVLVVAENGENGTYVLFGSDGNVHTEGEVIATASAANKELQATLDADAVLVVNVYVYFDGQDDNAKSAATISENPAVVAIGFTIGDTEPNPFA